ncbi:MAG: hypothetical protein M3O35_17405 [Acidobacteriota bacterium]|nr:hypothetical protein [Acidobacteriota bacterium]
MKLRFTLLTLALAISAFAADVTGKWTAEVKGRNGQSREITMNLKADGAALTGTVSAMGGDTEIKDGKVDGDTITFTVVREFNGNTVKINYTGKVDGDTINFKQQRDGGQGPAQEFAAKRAPSV